MLSKKTNTFNIKDHEPPPVRQSSLRARSATLHNDLVSNMSFNADLVLDRLGPARKYLGPLYPSPFLLHG